MTSLLSCVVATLALGAEPDLKGLPFGIPPAAEDAVIASIAPPKCLFYLNWAGTAAPHAKSGSETEKFLAEPEVQELLSESGRLITSSLKKLDNMASAATPDSVADSKGASGGAKFPAAEFGDFINVLLTHPTAVFVSDIKYHSDDPARRASETIYTSPNLRVMQNEWEKLQQPVDARPKAPPASFAAEATPQSAVFNDLQQFQKEWERFWLPNPNKDAIVSCPLQEDVCVAEAKPEPTVSSDTKPAALPSFSMHGGLVVSLGSDAQRVRAEFSRLVTILKKDSSGEFSVRRVKIRGESWYRIKTAPGDTANETTFGLHGNYFVLAVGHGSIEGILDRWKRPMPDWLAKAMAATPVPRRTGIIYLDAKLLRKALLQSSDTEAALKFAGLDNVRTLVSTTGLDEYGMINRVCLDIDGKPHGLIETLGKQPLTANDVEPIPNDALMAFAARFDLEKLLQKCDDCSNSDNCGSCCEQTSGDWLTEKLKAGLTHRLCASLGDSWCLYNSPTEGEMAFCGWTAVAKVRDRATLMQCLDAVTALPGGKVAAPDSILGAFSLTDGSATQIKKCQFAGRDIYYLSGQAFVPALTITDDEAVMTFGMPAMKAYLSRQDHHSLAAQPGVALALGDAHPPAAMCFCDTPRLFDFIYPMIAAAGDAGSSAGEQLGIDLKPTFLPSPPAIRRHLRPDITTLERTSNGLQLTCRYCLPSGGATGVLAIAALGAVGGNSPVKEMPTWSLFRGDPAVPPSSTTLPQALPAPAPSCEPAVGATSAPLAACPLVASDGKAYPTAPTTKPAPSTATAACPIAPATYPAPSTAPAAYPIAQAPYAGPYYPLPAGATAVCPLPTTTAPAPSSAATACPAAPATYPPPSTAPAGYAIAPTPYAGPLNPPSSSSPLCPLAPTTAPAPSSAAAACPAASADTTAPVWRPATPPSAVRELKSYGSAASATGYGAPASPYSSQPSPLSSNPYAPNASAYYGSPSYNPYAAPPPTVPASSSTNFPDSPTPLPAKASRSTVSTLSGKLYKIRTDPNGKEGCVLLDKSGVVRAFVTAARGVDLESSIGQEVTLPGKIQTWPDDGIPRITVTSTPETDRSSVSVSTAAKHEAITLMNLIRGDLAAGEISQAESLCRQLDKMRLPEKAFASEEDSPGRVFTAVKKARRNHDSDVVQTSGADSAMITKRAVAEVEDEIDGTDVHEPINSAISDAATEPPTQDEILKALGKAHHDGALQNGVTRTKIRMMIEPVKDTVDPPSSVPRIGQVQMHHIRFKCTVYYTETSQVDLPSPHKTVDENCKEVIYINRDHLHRVAK
jgi:hypothetical protein